MSSKETRVGKRVLLTGKKGKGRTDEVWDKVVNTCCLYMWLEKDIRVARKNLSIPEGLQLMAGVLSLNSPLQLPSFRQLLFYHLWELINMGNASLQLQKVMILFRKSPRDVSVFKNVFLHFVINEHEQIL